MDDQGELFPDETPKPDPMQAVLDRLAALESENQALSPRG